MASYSHNSVHQTTPTTNYNAAQDIGMPLLTGIFIIVLLDGIEKFQIAYMLIFAEAPKLHEILNKTV